jgi:hypothetical protein
MSAYASHYQACREAYGGTRDTTLYSDLYKLQVDTTILHCDEEYHNLVKVIAQKMGERFDTETGCHLDDHGLALRLNEWRDIDEVSLFAEYVMPQLEEKVFGCHLKIEFLMPYRNRVTANSMQSSWVWHYDDCPKEFLKFAVHLSDVTEESGCMQYLTFPAGETPVLESSRLNPRQPGSPIFPRSRIPASVVDHVCSTGGLPQPLLGPPGSYAIFTPNIMHRATPPAPKSTPRDAIFFYIRPALAKSGAYVSKSTKSFLPAYNTKQYDLD